MITPLDIAEALAWEARLFEEVVRHPEKHYVKLWQSGQCLVAPRKHAAQTGFEAARDAMAESGWPVHLRATGGDVTPQGPNIVNVTHVYSWPSGGPFNIEAAYDRLCTPIETALGPGASRGWQDGAFCDGAYNIQFDGKKFAGTAMRFRPCREDKSRHAVLAHALMLLEPPSKEAIEALNAYLTALGEPRRIRAEAHCGLPAEMSVDTFQARMLEAFETPDFP